MNTTGTFGIHFVLRSNKAYDGTAPIYARITIDKQRFEISLKQRIIVENWNTVKGMAKGKSPEIATLNSFLERIRNQLVNCYHDLLLNKQKVTPDSLKKRFYGIEESEQTLMNLIKYHNDRMDENLEWGTQKNYFTTEKYIFEFLNDKLKKKIFHLVNSTIDLSMILNTF
jgi:integrase/recombinase XerD